MAKLRYMKLVKERYAKVILKINGEKVLWNSSDLELEVGWY